MPEKETDQLTLAPDAPLESESVQLAVADLVGKKKGRLIGPMPSKDFVESVQTFGILQPILVVQSGKTLKIRDGRRRLRAAADAGLEWIPAFVVKGDGWSHDYLLGAIANEQRSDNGVATLEVLEQLRKEGVGESETLEATGISVARQRRLLKLTQLEKSLRKALEDGAISLDVAEDVCKLSAEQQAELAQTFRDNGSLTAADVREIKGVNRRRATEGLDEDIPEISLDWRERAVRALREAQAAIPPAAGQIRRSIEALISSVRVFEEPEAPEGPPITDPDKLPNRGHRQVQRVVETRVGASTEDDEIADTEEV